MKGKVLDFDSKQYRHYLRDNGSLSIYSKQWKEQINPIRGTAVDFESALISKRLPSISMHLSQHKPTY
jgi:hypothetical protein